MIGYNILKALILLFLPVYFAAFGLLLMGVYGWLQGLINRSTDRVLPWSFFVQVWHSFRNPSKDKGWLWDVMHILSLAMPIFALWLLPFSSVPTMSAHGDLLVIIFAMLFVPLVHVVLQDERKNGNNVRHFSYLGAYLSFILSTFEVASLVGSVKLSDIVSAQWLSYSGETAAQWISKDAFLTKLPMSSIIAILSMAFILMLSVKNHCVPSECNKYQGMSALESTLQLSVLLSLFTFMFLGPASLLTVTVKNVAVFAVCALIGVGLSFLNDKYNTFLNVLIVALGFVSLVIASI
ncbi:hypothetical protein [Coprothermobacter platensis]|uniref:hypothetical protein n=1 Tax=Coprothermobacter platensis TaxID=108819 RepID=UPI00037732AB|nr:hypothetical protein [Coprothermobacter platensis]